MDATWKTPRPGGARGAETHYQYRNADNHSRWLSEDQAVPDLIATHYCNCRPGVPCVLCLAWNRRIRSIEARRAESLRRQAIGGIVVGVAA